MTKACLIIAAITLSGCAMSVPAKLERGAVHIERTGKTPKEYADCMVAIDPAYSRAEPKGEGGFRIYRTLPGTYGDVMDVLPEGEGSRVEYYSQNPWKRACL